MSKRLDNLVNSSRGRLDIEGILQYQYEKFKREHIIISDTLLEIAKWKFPDREEDIKKAYDIARRLELGFWGVDNIIDKEDYSKLDRYLDLITIYESLLYLLENYESIDKKIHITKIIEKIRELMNLIVYEKKALQYTERGEIVLAVDTLLEGRSKNADIYVLIFNSILQTTIFYEYVTYRKLELLVKDFNDFLDDLENNNLSSSTLIYYVLRNNKVYDFETIKRKILKYASSLIENINDDYMKELATQQFKVLAEKVLPNYEKTLRKILSRDYI